MAKEADTSGRKDNLTRHTVSVNFVTLVTLHRGK